MHLLTYNIQAAIGARRTSDYIRHGYRQFFHTASKSNNLIAIGEFIKDFDVVCLQEVDLGGRRSGFQSQLDILSEVSGLTHIAAQTNRVVGRTSIHGNAILSRFPIKKITDHKLPGRIPGRGVLMCDINGTLILNTHLSLGPKTQVDQFEFIETLMKKTPRAVLVGDFNCRSMSKILQEFAQTADLTVLTTPLHKTYPAWSPRQDLDHVLVTKAFAHCDPNVLNPGLSDHRPVTVHLQG